MLKASDCRSLGASQSSIAPSLGVLGSPGHHGSHEEAGIIAHHAPEASESSALGGRSGERDQYLVVMHSRDHCLAQEGKRP